MDASKLPKFSRTPPPAAEAPAAGLETHQNPPVGYSMPDRGPVVGAEAWISIVIGLILLIACHRPIEYLFTRHDPAAFSWTFSDADGNPMAYPKTAFFLPDVGVVLFGLVLILDGLLLVMPLPRRLIWIAFGATVAMVALNLAAIVSCLLNDIGFQILPAFAVAFGGYMAVHQWRLVRARRYR